MTWQFDLVRIMYKFIIHLIYGVGEIERIVSRQSRDYNMIRHFDDSVRRSTKIRKEKLLLPSFSEKEEAQQIADVKKINSKHLPTIQFCLEPVKLINIAIDEILQMTKESYDSSNPRHEAQLMKFWSLMKPDVRMKSRISEEWGELGFQGKDPATDMRGMGILGLINLIHFAENRNTEARQVLLRSQYVHSFYPYACAGINFTSFVLTLLNRRRLNSLIIEEMTRNTSVTTTTAIVTEDAAKIATLAVFHRVYINVFLRFHQGWNQENPPNMTHFPRHFTAVKAIFEAEYDPSFSSISSAIVNVYVQ